MDKINFVFLKKENMSFSSYCIQIWHTKQDEFPLCYLSKITPPYCTASDLLQKKREKWVIKKCRLTRCRLHTYNFSVSFSTITMQTMYQIQISNIFSLMQRIKWKNNCYCLSRISENIYITQKQLYLRRACPSQVLTAAQLLLKGSVSREFQPPFFSWFEPTVSRPLINRLKYLNMFSILPKYSNF